MLVYRMESVDYLKDDSLFAQGYDHVPDYRRKKIDALRRPEDKRLSLGAELLLEKMLRDAGFASLAERRDIAYTKLGKPFLRDEGVPADKASQADVPVHFSLSHSIDHVMCVLSDTPVGCDIEHADAHKTNCPQLARRFFCKNEADVIEAEPYLFYTYWTLKEAYGKCTETAFPVVLRTDIITALKSDSLKTDSGISNGYMWAVVKTLDGKH